MPVSPGSADGIFLIDDIKEVTMRILVVNSNTSDFVTGKVAEEARRVAAADTEIITATGTFGARVIGTRSENAIAEHMTLQLVAEHAGGCDAVLIAVSYDTALRAARELLSIPVVGMTEAALLTGCMLGGKIGVIVFGRRVLPVYQEVVAAHGLSSRIAGWRAIESSAPYAPGDQSEVERLLLEAIDDLVERDYAEVILLSGAVMAGVSRRLQGQVRVPLLDGIGCGIRQAELLVRLGVPKPATGSYAALPARELIDVSPALIGAFQPQS
jgi:Asp/Glu/hydantoin racemase